MNIQTMLANKMNYGGKRNTSDIKYIVIHYTANDGDKAINNCIYYRDRIVKASAHYYCDDNEIWQSVPDDYVAWAVGGNKYNTPGGRLYKIATNANTISIETCDTVRNGQVYPTEPTIKNVIVLTKELMKKYNIPIERVIRHYDVNGKPCPAYWVDDKRWKTEFLERLVENKIIRPTETVIPNTQKYKIICDELNIRKGPGTNYPVVGVVKKNYIYTIVETSGNWGRLLSGAGWISLASKYCTRQ